MTHYIMLNRKSLVYHHPVVVVIVFLFKIKLARRELAITISHPSLARRIIVKYTFLACTFCCPISDHVMVL